MMHVVLNGSVTLCVRARLQRGTQSGEGPVGRIPLSVACLRVLERTQRS